MVLEYVNFAVNQVFTYNFVTNTYYIWLCASKEGHVLLL